MMSAAQTMEAVNMTASTLMVLMSVSVEVAMYCHKMGGTALVYIRRLPFMMLTCMWSLLLCFKYIEYSS